MSRVTLTRLHAQHCLHTCSSSLISWSRGELALLPSASGLGSSALSSLIWVGIVLVCLHAPPFCNEHPGARMDCIGATSLTFERSWSKRTALQTSKCAS